MTVTSTFGELQRVCRLRAGLTQEELAERTEMSARGLGYLERGDRLPHKGTERRLAEALGLPVLAASFIRRRFVMFRRAVVFPETRR